MLHVPEILRIFFTFSINTLRAVGTVFATKGPPETFLRRKVPSEGQADLTSDAELLSYSPYDYIGVLRGT